MRAPRGFTLIELMIVLSIVGILAAISLPNISSMTERRSAKIELTKFGNTIRAARDTAREQRRCVTLARTSASTIQVTTFTLLPTGACSAVVDGAPKVIQFNPKYIDFSTAPNLTFARNGGLSGVPGVDSVVIPVSSKHSETTGTGEAHTFRVFTTLGLVRQVL